MQNRLGDRNLSPRQSDLPENIRSEETNSGKAEWRHVGKAIIANHFHKSHLPAQCTDGEQKKEDVPSDTSESKLPNQTFFFEQTEKRKIQPMEAAEPRENVKAS